ncbi:hypothetical protein HMY34_01400 [Thiothrix subterranea]|uniref:hypothetical protein n=1 Tax=Thiothrix subterranea TaxID=2735563 RepID=UPI00192C3DB8|nr:hypothetical protein [Thiothrix subterranea]QQZ27519.1 hypothetical protein HMY34_01400 [Thiothrix subterranea]
MNQLKQVLIASVLTVSLAGVAIANPAVQNNDLNQVFNGQTAIESVQATALSDKEMQATEGEFWPVFWALAAVALGVKGSTRGCGGRRC